MRPYVAILGARFRVLLQYRAAAFAGLVTQLFWGLIRVMIFEAFYRSGAGPQPMSLPEVTTYIWLGQAMLGMLPWSVDRDIQANIRSGVVAYEIARPVDLHSFWYARSLALRSAPTLLRALPLFAIATTFFGMSPPAAWAAAGAWLAATFGALLMSAAITTLLTTSLLWTLSGEGTAVILTAAITLLSGMIVPLPLFPDWAQPILSALPFRGLMDAPFRLYVGHIPAAEVVGVLLHQAIWTGVLIVAGRALLARGMRRVVVQGG